MCSHDNGCSNENVGLNEKMCTKSIGKPKNIVSITIIFLRNASHTHTGVWSSAFRTVTSDGGGRIGVVGMACV